MKASGGSPISVPLHNLRQDLTKLGCIQRLESGIQVCLVAEGGHFPISPELPDPGVPGEWRRVRGFIGGCIYPYGGTGLYAWVPQNPTLPVSRTPVRHGDADAAGCSPSPDSPSICVNGD